MIAASMSIENLLTEAEPYIRRAGARIGELPGMGVEDVCQELRIQVLQLATSFEPSRRVPWTAYLRMHLRQRGIDVMRANGVVTRKKKAKRRQRHYSLDFNCDEATPLDPPCIGEELPELEWRDVFERASQEPTQVRAMLWWAAGTTMREIGLRLGITESRVSQLLSPNHPTHPQMLERLCVLMGVDGRRRVITNQPGRN